MNETTTPAEFVYVVTMIADISELLGCYADPDRAMEAALTPEDDTFEPELNEPNSIMEDGDITTLYFDCVYIEIVKMEVIR